MVAFPSTGGCIYVQNRELRIGIICLPHCPQIETPRSIPMQCIVLSTEPCPFLFIHGNRTPGDEP